MRKITDRTGDTWEVVLTYAELEDAKAAGIDLGEVLTDEKAVAAFFMAGNAKFAALARLVLADQIAAKNITDRDFLRRLDGPTVRAFVTAALEEAVDFFPLSPLAEAVRGSLPAVMEMIGKEMAGRYSEQIASLNSGGPPPGTSASPTSGP